jgi:hypothetical protein
MTSFAASSSPTTSAAVASTTTTAATTASGARCEVCRVNFHKYKCPRCMTLTCSLDCCKTHKAASNCTGVRDKTKYVGKEEFDESQLLSDYRFLEEQQRLVEAAQRDSLLNAASKPQQRSDSSSWVSSYFDNLAKFARKQFNIKLLYMPPNSTRHTNNKTKFNRQEVLISWSLEMAFDVDEGNKETLSIVPSTKRTQIRFHTGPTVYSAKLPLRQLLLDFYSTLKRKLLDTQSTTTKLASSSSDEMSTFLAMRKQYGAEFENEKLNEINVLLEQVDYELKKRYIVLLDMSSSLEQSLAGRTIVEYPTLYVVNRNRLIEYDLIDDRSTEVSPNKSTSARNGDRHRNKPHSNTIELSDKAQEVIVPETIACTLTESLKRKLEENDELEEGECD